SLGFDDLAVLELDLGQIAPRLGADIDLLDGGDASLVVVEIGHVADEGYTDADRRRRQFRHLRAPGGAAHDRTGERQKPDAPRVKEVLSFHGGWSFRVPGQFRVS